MSRSGSIYVSDIGKMASRSQAQLLRLDSRGSTLQQSLVAASKQVHSVQQPDPRKGAKREDLVIPVPIEEFFIADFGGLRPQESGVYSTNTQNTQDKPTRVPWERDRLFPATNCSRATILINHPASLDAVSLADP